MNIIQKIYIGILISLSIIPAVLLAEASPPSQLVLQMARDDSDVKECVKKGGVKKTSAVLVVRNLALSSAKDEKLVDVAQNPDDCLLCGARRCNQWVYGKNGLGYRLLLKIEGADDVQVMSSSNNGFRDLKIVYPAGNSYPSTSEIYRFDGGQYRERKGR